MPRSCAGSTIRTGISRFCQASTMGSSKIRGASSRIKQERPGSPRACAICWPRGSPERFACRPRSLSVERQVRGPLPPDPAKRLAALERLDEEVDVARRLRVEATQPDRMHLELGRQQIPDLAGLLIATLSEVLHVFSPLRGRPQPRAPGRPKVTVSAISAANYWAWPDKNQSRRSCQARRACCMLSSTLKLLGLAAQFCTANTNVRSR